MPSARLNSRLHTTLIWDLGSIQVSGDVPSLPSLRSGVWVEAQLGFGLGLREGRVGISPETCIDLCFVCLQACYFMCQYRRPVWWLLHQWLQESIQSQGMSMQHLSPAFGELCTCHQLGPTTGLDTASITLANATDIVALASRSLIAVANHDTILDFTQTLSPEGRCIF